MHNHPAQKKHHAAQVAEAFTYFDCTDYIDEPANKGILTEARNYKKQNPKGGIPYREHVRLLWKYASPFVRKEKHINIHGGYFDGVVTQRLIYRLACLGFDGAVAAYCGGELAMLEECSKHQIRVILSKRLEPNFRRLRERREDMETSVEKVR